MYQIVDFAQVELEVPQIIDDHRFERDSRIERGNPFIIQFAHIHVVDDMDDMEIGYVD